MFRFSLLISKIWALCGESKAVFRGSETKDPGLLIILNLKAEAGNVAENVMASHIIVYVFNNFLRAVTFRSDNGSDFDRAIT